MVADGGYDSVINNHAGMLLYGREIAVNSYYYKIATDKGQISSMVIYGKLVESGDGVDVNKTEVCEY